MNKPIYPARYETGSKGDTMAKCPNCDNKNPLLSLVVTKSDGVVGKYRNYFHAGEIFILFERGAAQTTCPLCGAIVEIKGSDIVPIVTMNTVTP